MRTAHFVYPVADPASPAGVELIARMHYRGGERGLGKLYELRAIWDALNGLNLGKPRSDENALWSLGAHDVSAVLSLSVDTPVEAWAQGAAFVRDGVEDVVFAFLR